MIAKTVYDIFHESPLGEPVAAYFAVTAVAAGALLLAGAIRILGLRGYRTTIRNASLVAFLAAGLAGLLLIAEIGRPLSFWRVFTSINPTSPLSWGTVILMAFTIVCLSNLLIVFGNKDDAQTGIARALPSMCVIVALLVPLYTSFELVLAKLSPAWQAGLVPALFYLAAGVAGPSAVILLGGLASWNPVRRLGAGRLDIELDAPEAVGLTRVIRLFLGLSAAAVLLQLLSWFTAQPAVVAAARSLTGGEFAVLFWAGYLLLGTLVPLLALAPRFRGHGKFRVAAAMLALFGVFVLRWLDLLSGQIVGPL